VKGRGLKSSTEANRKGEGHVRSPAVFRCAETLTSKWMERSKKWIKQGEMQPGNLASV